MNDSGALLYQISSLKDKLDEVNEEIESNIQVTREIESEIVKCSEIENDLAARESQLLKDAYMLRFEIHGLVTVTGKQRLSKQMQRNQSDSKTSLKLLEEEIQCLRTKKEEVLEKMTTRRESFMASCLSFQKEIEKGENDGIQAMLSEKDSLEDEIHSLDTKHTALRNSTTAFQAEVLRDLQSSISVLEVEIQTLKIENDKLLKDIDELKRTLIATCSS